MGWVQPGDLMHPLSTADLNGGQGGSGGLWGVGGSAVPQCAG